MSVELLTAGVIATAETSLNTLLQKDPKTLRRLGNLSGKVIRFNITQPSLVITLAPHSQGIDLLMHSEATADLTLSGHATDFMQMAQSDQPDEKLFGKGISLQGDTALATEFSQILRGFQIDWEAWLADLIGDTWAHPLAHFMQSQGQQFEQYRQSIQDNTLEYLQEELRILPPRVEVDIFTDDVEQLRDDAARLEAKLNRLELALTIKKASSARNIKLE